MELPQPMVAVMFRITAAALGNNWRRGRRSRLTAAAAAYIACRQQRKPVTLLDVAQVLQEDVFAVGRKAMEVAHGLQLALPGADPAMLGLDGSPTKVVRIFTPENRTVAEILRGEPHEVVDILVENLKETVIGVQS